MSSKSNGSFRERLKYRIEKHLSKGASSIILWLTAITVFVTLFFGVVLAIFHLKPTDDSVDPDLPETIWQSLMHSIDAGSVAGDTNWVYRGVGIIITFIGILIFGSLVGVLTTGLDATFTEIRKGKSKVLDQDFTLILGWSPTIFRIIEELTLANANHKGKKVVILADRDKIEMEDEIAAKVNQAELLAATYPGMKTFETEVICRTGDALDLDDLMIVSPENAQSIIILPAESLDADAFVIKIVLALDSKGISCPIITEIKQEANQRALKLWADGAQSSNKVYIPSFEWLGKITAQTSRQSGYSRVLNEILHYANNEIYFVTPPAELINKPFEEALLACQDSILLGLAKGGSKVMVNPLDESVPGDEQRMIRQGDQLILLQADDDSLKVNLAAIPAVKDALPYEGNAASLSQTPETLLIIGWNDKMNVIVKELSYYVPKGSVIHILADIPDLQERIGALTMPNDNLTLKGVIGDSTNYDILQKLELDQYKSVILLGYHHLDIQSRDARSILTLLHLKKLLGSKVLNIVAEMYDDKNRRIVELSNACDYIISENIISSMMTQLSEQVRLFEVFNDLLDADGSEIYLKPLDVYLPDGKYDFYALQRAATPRNEIVMGFRLASEVDNADRNYGVYINPDKRKTYDFTSADKLIVISAN